MTRQQRGEYPDETQAILDGLPTPTAKPCAECPWRREAVRGYLGPHTAEEWVEIAHSDSPIACHMTIKHNDQDWAELRQCGGSTIFRANICKTPRHPNVAVADETDTEQIFSWDGEFIDHHKAANDREVRERSSRNQ